MVNNGRVSSTEKPSLGKRGERRPRDMALSIGILIVPIVLLLGFYNFALDGDEPVAIDAAPTLEAARAANVFEVTTPDGLDDAWHLQSATFKRENGGATLRLGYSDPDSEPVQLVESSVATATLIPAELGDSPEATGTVLKGARTWQQYDARPGEVALVLLEKGRSLIVIGQSEPERLAEFVSTLP